MKRCDYFCALFLVFIFICSANIAAAYESRQINIRNIDVCAAVKAVARSFEHNFIAQSGISGAVSLSIDAHDMSDAMEQIEQETGLGLILHGNTWILVTDDNVAPTADALAESEDLFYDQTISIDFTATAINSVISILARHTGVAIEIEPSFSGLTTINFSDVTASEVINMIAAINGLSIEQADDQIFLKKSDRQPESWISAPADVGSSIGIELIGIIGNDNSRTAMIRFENMVINVTENMVVQGKFKVLEIQSDRIIIYDQATQQRNSIPLEK